VAHWKNRQSNYQRLSSKDEKMIKSNNYSTKSIGMTALVLGLALVAAEPAFAQGGLEKVNTFVENVLVVLRGISIGVVTVAIMWAGYKFLFKNADMAECGKILAGGLLIGGAAELAGYLLA
jgi:hypothetical protein